MFDCFLNKLNYITEKHNDKKIYIMGHKNPDVDSYLSSYILEQILISLGYEAEAVLLVKYNDIDEITMSVIEKYKIKKFRTYIPCKQDIFFLVDHNTLEESIGTNIGEVVGIIDHHLYGSPNAIINEVYNAGSTTRLLLNLYETLNIIPDNYIKELILIALLIDTCGLTNSKTDKSDKDIANELCIELNLNLNELKAECIFETNLNQPIESILSNGLKETLIKNYKVGSSYIEFSKNKNIVLQNINNYVNIAKDTKYDLFLFILYDFEFEQTIVLTFGKVSIPNMSYNCIASRGSTIIPEIRKLLNE